MRKKYFPQFKQPKSSRQHGFSIIELMISSALGIFLTAGALSLYSSNKNSYRIQQAISNTLKNSRFIISRLEKSIASAGYSGFFGSYVDGVENTLNSPTNILWDIEIPVKGYNNVSSSDTIAGITGITAGTDVLVLKSMADESNLISQASSSSFTINAASGYSDGDIVIITDLNKASMFQISDADDTSTAGQTTVTVTAGSSPKPGNAALPINTFDNTATVGRLETVIYFLKTNANGSASLYEGRLTTSTDPDVDPITTAIEIIPNVENIQFIYGIDSDSNNSIDKYIDASTVTAAEWGLVHTIGVSLLLHSDEDNITDNSTSYSFDSTNFTFTRDTTPSSTATKHLKQTINTYIKLRNL